MAGFDRFGTKWAGSGAVSPPSATQFAQGFSFLGNTPPSVELFNAMFQEQDEKINWLWGQLQNVLVRGGITPAPTPATQLYDALVKGWGGGPSATNTLWLPNGKMMQWGTATASPNDFKDGVWETGVPVAFPVAFRTRVLSIHTTVWDIGFGPGGQDVGGRCAQENTWVTARSLTGCVIGFTARVGGIGMTTDWLALGE